jgi:murein L,D-transpeptidase YcbB/YkuD
MSVLKKGSKGADVRRLQEALNKVKSKPQLDLDGDFGKQTEAAVRDFQKRAKIKVDGKVGDVTWAALKNGGPLPEMTVPDQSERLKKIEDARRHNRRVATDYTLMWGAADRMARTLEKTVPLVQKSIDANQSTYDKVIKNCKSMIKMQADFDKLRLSDPKKATAIARKVELLSKENQALNAAKLAPNLKRTGDLVGKMKTSVLSNTDTLRTFIKKIEARAKA